MICVANRKESWYIDLRSKRVRVPHELFTPWGGIGIALYPQTLLEGQGALTICVLNSPSICLDLNPGWVILLCLFELFWIVYLYLSTSLWSFAVNGLNQGVTFNCVIWLSWSRWSWRNAISSGDCFNILSISHYQSLQMTSMQVVETSVTTINNSPSQKYNTIECSYTSPLLGK